VEHRRKDLVEGLVACRVEFVVEMAGQMCDHVNCSVDIDCSLVEAEICSLDCHIAAIECRDSAVVGGAVVDGKSVHTRSSRMAEKLHQSVSMLACINDLTAFVHFAG
jgi:hypothetical protein